MCGRFTLTADQTLIQDYMKAGYAIEGLELKDEPRYNIAPSQQVLTILHDGLNYRAGHLKWGFIPAFAKDERSFQIINAKSETLLEKPSFKHAFSQKRCIILADGFYEWHQKDGRKIPHYIYLKNRNIFAMAGLYETYIDHEGNKVHTTAIITTAANDLMSSIHDRMPVILDVSTAKKWLNRNENDISSLKQLLTPYNSSYMTHHTVSSLVNNVRNEIKSCIDQQ